MLVRAVHQKARRHAARLLMGGVCDQCTSTSELPALSETTAGKTTPASYAENNAGRQRREPASSAQTQATRVPLNATAQNTSLCQREGLCVFAGQAELRRVHPVDPGVRLRELVVSLGRRVLPSQRACDLSKTLVDGTVCMAECRCGRAADNAGARLPDPVVRGARQLQLFVLTLLRPQHTRG